jgi:hypothetical protein
MGRCSRGNVQVLTQGTFLAYAGFAYLANPAPISRSKLSLLSADCCFMTLMTAAIDAGDRDPYVPSIPSPPATLPCRYPNQHVTMSEV